MTPEEKASRASPHRANDAADWARRVQRARVVYLEGARPIPEIERIFGKKALREAVASVPPELRRSARAR